MVERLPGGVRWILVLPAAVAAYLGVQLAIIVIGGISSFLNGGGWPNWLYQLVNSAAGPYASVAVAAAIAPHGKFPTAVVVGLLNAALGLLLIVQAFSQSGAESDAWLLLAFAGVLAIASSGYASYQVWREEHPIAANVAASSS